MLFRQLFDQESCSYTYLIASDYGREGIIIDPVKKNIHFYIQLISQLNLRLVASLDSHLHADHITATGDLCYELGCQSMMGVQTKAEYVAVKFGDNDILNFDGIKLKAIHTPGHTDDSYCFLLNNMVFTGDTLLIRGTGRTDFQNGDPGLQYDSLFTRLLNLPDHTVIYPNHDYNGMTVSTIGEEKKFNPRLQVTSREQYIDIMNNLNLSLPKLMSVALPENLKCGMSNHVLAEFL
ncbi:MAG: Zn-dependent hydrolase [Legionellales bacterium RIFCSPHIGHO2_12_FULL_37_14]|nr:MAG: Zn-dependent hydrolase [Legionellales bacterium RIFCSPHIGHO2_12_FULL_37_14]